VPTLNPTDFLSTAQLADLYPVEGKIQFGQWYRALESWRDRKLLTVPTHIRTISNARLYLHSRVAEIVWTSNRLFAERVKSSNYVALHRILKIPSIP
jgi:hypothetical protein